MASTHFVYIAQCADSTLYCGYTTNISKRINAHNQGIAAKYTRSRLPVNVVYSESFSSKSDALKRELAIKRLPRQQKLKLIQGDP
ncbi:MAG: GIY-YIG nuclease family protein [Burkholderiales bacterium]|jgi:putative endonuclease|nr:GIY-YIG nuclease family protein [Burkholderiales bacterium]